MKISKLILVWLLTLGITACTTTIEQTPETPSDDTAATNAKLTDRHYELIVTDIVTAMVQIQELNPYVTTLQVSRARGQYGLALIEALEAAGYGLQLVSADQGVNYLSYQNRITQSEVGISNDFVVTVGGIEIRREYDLDGQNIVPASLMYVKGSRSLGNIVLNEDVFLQQEGAINFENGVELELPDSTVVSTATTDVGQRGAGGTSRVEQDEALIFARNASITSSGKEILSRKSEYKPLRRAKLSFPDSSMQIGRENKAILRSLLNEVDHSKDAFFITSCAGNSGTLKQAKSRATRVTEELVLMGVSSNAVVEEGCVIAEYPDGVVPPRTVLVMHRRPDSNFNIATAKLPISFPNRPLAMTIPYGAGGATDFQARIVTMVASEEELLGQPILIVNKPGQGGRAGWSWFAETAKDTGYDIATYNVPHFIAQSIKFSTPYNIDTLEPIANWGADPAVLVVPANSPFSNLREYVSWAKNNPGRLTTSGAGLYVGHHIAMLQLQKSANIELDYQWGKGGAAALKQVVDGEVMSGFNNMSDAFRMGDKVRILAIADLERNPVIPTVPTFSELGLEIDDSSVNYRGIMVPKGTPKEIVDSLSESVIKMFNYPIVVSKMSEGGAPLKIMKRQEVLNMWNERQAYLTDLLKDL